LTGRSGGGCGSSNIGRSNVSGGYDNSEYESTKSRNEEEERREKEDERNGRDDTTRESKREEVGIEAKCLARDLTFDYRSSVRSKWAERTNVGQRRSDERTSAEMRRLVCGGMDGA
jgi:hypothetical protein